MVPLNDLSRRMEKYSQEMAGKLVSVLRNGVFINGREVSAFETEFRNYLNCKFALGVANGTDALEISLRALGCGENSKIISVANAGAYTAIAAQALGSEILYCDIDYQSLTMDPNYLKRIITSDISAVVITHLYGNSARVHEIREICDKFEVPLVEDCAQAVGATAGKIRLGTIGHLGAFSFYPTKNLGAFGDAGAVVTNDLVLADKVMKLRQYGWISKYEIGIAGGRNSRLDEIQAAFLRIELAHLEERNSARRRIASIYFQSLKNSDVKLATSCRSESVAHLAVLLLPNYVNREMFMSYMASKGVETGIHYPTLDYHQPVLQKSATHLRLPVSEDTIHRIVTIPIFPEMYESEINVVSQALSDFVA